MIAQQAYEWIVETLFGEITDNVWYSQNLDIIRGISVVIVCSIVFALAVGLVIGIWRFFERCLGVRV